jgi:multidrug transporter EmrE-like cation transporter
MPCSKRRPCISSEWKRRDIASEQVRITALKASEGFTQPLPSPLALSDDVLLLDVFDRSMRALPMGLAFALWSGLGMKQTHNSTTASVSLELSSHAFKRQTSS